MRLKSLYINGFKSFYGKTLLEFHPGITIVVGPNGCGKSNVVDAIRWVLGETSAKALRGSEMADVIFNGSEKRKPLGLAEVTLTLADCEEILETEFNEIAVTRRVYRDGKSEYLINKRPCRLRDIQELFMDTGIGRSAYSIMEQGKMDQLLSSKPEDRRAVFEEAAGITKFKTQKKEALRKLDYTEANLLRVQDIIAEVQRQINSLQRQASKAKRYQALFNDLKTLDSHLSHERCLEIKENQEVLELRLEELTGIYEKNQKDIESNEQLLREKRERLHEKENKISELRQKQLSIQNNIQNNRNQIGRNNERKSELTPLIKRFEEEISESSEKEITQQEQLQSTKTELTALSQKIEEKHQQLKFQDQQTAEIRAKKNRIQEAIAQIQRQSSEAEHQRVTIHAQIEARETQLQHTRQNHQKLLEEHQKQNEHQQKSIAEAQQIESQLQHQNNQHLQQERELKEIESQHQEAQNQLYKQEQKLHEIHRELTQKSSRLQILEQHLERGDSLQEGAQNIIKEIKRTHESEDSFHGVLGNHIEVEDRYITAIETALGHHLQAILIDQSVSASNFLHKLQKNAQGTASFLPKDLINLSSPKNTHEHIASSLGYAVEYIKTTEELSPLLYKLLDNTWIVESLSEAVSLHQKYPAATFVSLQGEILTPLGSLSGGRANKKAPSLLHEQNESRKIKEAVQQLEKKHKEQESNIAQQREQLQKLEQKREQYREKLQQIRIAKTTLENQQKLFQRDSQQTQARLEKVQWELNSLEKRQTDDQAALQQLKEQKKSVEQKSTALQNELTEQNISSEKIHLQLETEIQQLNTLQTNLAIEQRARENLEQTRQPLFERLKELRERIEQRKQEITHSTNKLNTSIRETQQLEEIIKNEETELQETEAGIKQHSQERDTHSSQLLEIETRLQHTRQETSKINEQRSDSEIKRTQLQLRLENLSDTIRQRYQLEINHFKPEPEAFTLALENQKLIEKNTVPENGILDIENLQRHLEEMRRKLEKIGSVNLDAIEEFEALKERFEFLEKQHHDLTHSKEDLLQVIKKINRTTRKMFSETFEQIAKHFKTMFRELFGSNARASLTLREEDNPLESGIDIMAKPPGKQPQSISLLSGGERALTAVALLFSIYLVKPSPFCVLDELDAPLDDANISRFLKILDQFTHQSQFLIVSHNKRTMTRGDIIYGITMEERGVSKPISMKMTPSESPDTHTPIHEEKEPAVLI